MRAAPTTTDAGLSEEQQKAIAAAQTFVDNFNETYNTLHESFETQFWGTRMALQSTPSQPYSSELLSQTKKEMEDLLSSPKILKQARDHRLAIQKSQNKTLETLLNIIERTCSCYAMSPEAKQIRERTTHLESDLERSMCTMPLGYYTSSSSSNDEGTFCKVSSVGLRHVIRTCPNESARKSAYEALRSIGPFVCQNGFVEIVKLRNEFAKLLGFEDYFAYKLYGYEGFDKKTLFGILDGLEESTRGLMERSNEEFRKTYGDEALEPWNMGYTMAGSVVKLMDPYFPFSKSVSRYLHSYSALNINYQSATMTLDLLDRPDKYPNGFCHWPKVAWIRPDGTHQPSHANFTSLADPTAIGSGLTALTTLMHEAGHAAHFANITQPSPLCSQERCPTSPSYAENQSMFLDSLVSDAAWRAKYAKDLDDRTIPFEIIEREIRATQPFAVFSLRRMIAVSYFEKALYELPEEEVTMERILMLADEVEVNIQGRLSGGPMMSIPHLLADEASCYYQGYTLAEMSVHQTRDYFKQTYGTIVDNPHVGPTLQEYYWKCGNSRPFLDLVRNLTKKELSGEAWTKVLEESVEDKIKRERLEYEEALKVSDSSTEAKKDVEHLNMVLYIKDGDDMIADSKEVGGLLKASEVFEEFVAKRIAVVANKM